MKIKLSLLAFSALMLTQVGMDFTGAHHTILRLELSQFPAQMKQLHALDFDIAGVNLNAHTVDLVVDDLQAKQIHDLGFKVINTKSQVGLTRPDNNYQTPEKIEALLKKYAAQYPTLAQVQSVGKSLEGRDIWAIKITSNVSQPDPAKPHIFFNGMHHAREVMSVEIPLDTIETLLKGYGKDSKITHWVDANEIWVLPMFNVDGNNKVWNSESMWRKNTRGGYGVDINRNYPYAWNSCNGSSNSQSAQDYHGPSGASEPETVVMMNLVKAIRPVFSISYHSYSEIVIYPFGCEGQHTPTKEVVESIGAEMASLIVSDDGEGRYRAGTAPELLYSVDGGDIDWMYHEASVIPYVIEVNADSQGFQPSYRKWRQKTVDNVRPAWELLLDKLDGSSLHGQVKTPNGEGVGTAVVHLERTSGGNPFVQDYPVRQDGYFDIIVPTGQYKVTYSAPGMQDSVQSLSVGSVRVETNASLQAK